MRKRVQHWEQQQHNSGKHLALRRCLNLLHLRAGGRKRGREDDGDADTSDSNKRQRTQRTYLYPHATSCGINSYDVEYKDVSGAQGRCTQGFAADKVEEYLRFMQTSLRVPFVVVRGHQHNNAFAPFNSTSSLCDPTTPMYIMDQQGATREDVTKQVYFDDSPAGICTWTAGPFVPPYEALHNLHIQGPGCGLGVVSWTDGSPPRWEAYWDGGDISRKQCVLLPLARARLESDVTATQKETTESVVKRVRVLRYEDATDTQQDELIHATIDDLTTEGILTKEERGLRPADVTRSEAQTGLWRHVGHASYLPPPQVTVTDIQNLEQCGEEALAPPMASQRYVRFTRLGDNVKRIAVIGDLHGNWDGFAWNMLVMGESTPSEDRRFWLPTSKALRECTTIDDWVECLTPHPDAAVIFTGDLLDRGMYGLPILCIVYRLLRSHPDNVFVTIGNHDFDNNTYWDRYGFATELTIRCLSQYRAQISNAVRRAAPSVHFLVHPRLVIQAHHGLSAPKDASARINIMQGIAQTKEGQDVVHSAFPNVSTTPATCTPPPPAVCTRALSGCVMQ